ncbi:uncharacterized protein STEHIDRAFT_63693, partial [Stereum hirsutum FP-91666 SS1]|uniref:uncharacterized protein n=1 Tax=Stereum hirsutum (strain FP-91666) TaxID=721885 RepID=UPI000444A5CD
VIRYTTTWGHHHYHVHSSTATRTVFPSLPQSPATPAFCTCPAFSKAILLMDSHIMCKHVLAVQLADRLGKFVEKQVGPDDFVALLRTES